jgi:hypothetical protein
MKEKPSRWPSFTDFLEQEFLRCAAQPWDSMARAAYEKLGQLGPDKLLNYVPSLLITGEESLENVSIMNSVAAMIANGDLYRQLADQPFDRAIAQVDIVKDEVGRDRLQVIWAE